MTWFIENYQRFRQERLGLERLVGQSDWLRPLDWRIDSSLRMNWDADIAIGDHTFEVTLRYPNHFPHSPPLVIPRDDKSAHWSTHQWGPGGELCLEIGPDNWQPHITGAEMIASAHRLLVMETDGVSAAAIPSRHEITLGQIHRLTFSRLIKSHELTAFVAANSRPVVHGKANVGFHEECVVYAVTQFDLGNGETWNDTSVPALLPSEQFLVDCILVRLPLGEALPEVSTAEGFREYLASLGIVPPSPMPLVLFDNRDLLRVYRLYEANVAIVNIVATNLPASRLPSEHVSLSDRSVAMVGCGSVGSKIACSLARSGVGKFLLVDDDLFLPENLVRSDLDWREIGTHKTDAVRRRIQFANPATEVEARRHRLGGHEASGNLEALIERIAGADLIIDATSTAEAFNYLCAAADTGSTPMIWAEVHGGGIGGMIGRHRPGIEPPPAIMRLSIENWCADKGIVIERAKHPYEDRNANSSWIADDADVSVIAGHAARFAIDLLIPRSPSLFPYSVYFIGLAEGWFYTEPFHTEPVILPPYTPPNIPPLKEAEAVEELSLMGSILRRSLSATDPS